MEDLLTALSHNVALSRRLFEGGVKSYEAHIKLLNGSYRLYYSLWRLEQRHTIYHLHNRQKRLVFNR